MTEPLTPGRRQFILLVCSLAIFVAQIDMTALNVALPSIRRDLGASTAQLQWVSDIYMLVLATLVLLSGSLGDRFGRRRVLIIGLIIFAAGSLMAGLAPDPGLLIVARAVQAVGGSMMPPIALAIVNSVFPNPAERARAIGVWGAIMGVAMAAGPVIGGVLIGLADWRWIFWINVPLSVAAIVAIRLVAPESRAARPRGFDPAGQLLAITVLAATTFTIMSVGEGHRSPGVVATGVLAAVSIGAFVAVERRVAAPMLETRFFASLPFSLAGVIALFGFATHAGFIFVTALMLQEDLGLSPLTAGLSLIPLALSNSLAAVVAGRLVARVGNRIPLITFAALQFLAGLLMLTVGEHTSTTRAWWMFATASVLMGAALGTVNTSLTNTALGGMPRSQSGVAGATLSTFRQTGQCLGVAIMGALLNTGLRAGHPVAQAAHPGLVVTMVLAAVAGLLGLLATTRHALCTQARVQESFSDQ